MAPIAWHLTARLADDRVITPDLPARRRAARIVLHFGAGAGLLAFRIVDTHLHALIATSRLNAGQFAPASLGTLSQTLALPVPFAPARIRPIEDQRHLRNAFDYILANDRHHSAAGDPWHDRSNLLDLLGLRTIGVGTAVQVRRLLPRVTRADLLVHLGVAELPTGAIHADHLPTSVLAATALPSTAGRSAEATAARIAVAALGLDNVTTAGVLGTTTRSVLRLRKLPADPLLVEAICRQAAWRAARAEEAVAPWAFAAAPMATLHA